MSIPGAQGHQVLQVLYTVLYYYYPYLNVSIPGAQRLQVPCPEQPWKHVLYGRQYTNIHLTQCQDLSVCVVESHGCGVLTVSRTAWPLLHTDTWVVGMCGPDV